jgi:hypothetical protein
MFNTHHWSVSLTVIVSALFCARTTVVAEDAPARTSFGAFEFAIPSKWSRVEPPGAKTAAMLLLNGSAWNNADAMIKVDFGKPAAPTPQALAKALAGKDGKVSPDPVLVDGEKGVKVETTSTDMSRPKVAVIVYRNGTAYLIMGAEKNGSAVSGALDEVVKSWKWSKADKAEK